MRLAKIAIAAASLILVSANAPALAWGKIGHRVVGQIAQGYLTEDAEKAIADILGVEDLAEVSDWPDYMRSDTTTDYFRKEAYPYHFVTVPNGVTYDDVGAPPEGDSVTALMQFRATIKDPDASAEDKRLALIFIVHIIGDLHQPLHVGKGDDWGGNKVKILFKGEESNLHKIWDEDLVRDEELSFTEMATWLNRKITPDDVSAWSDTNPKTWIAESAAIRPGIYPKDGEEDLSWTYVWENRPIVRQRLSQGGIRLAAYLNELFATE